MLRQVRTALLVALLAVLALPAVAQAGEVSSHDGEHVAFVAQDGLRVREVRSGAERLVAPAAPGERLAVEYGAWSPDDAWVVVEVRRAGEEVVGARVVDVQGGRMRDLGPAVQFGWAHDGSVVLLRQGEACGPPLERWVLSAAGGDLRLDCPESPPQSLPSPTGAHVLYGLGGSMWLREAVTGRVWRVAAVDPAGYGGPSDPSWSPDGRHLVYEWHRPGSGVPVVFAVGVDRAASVQLGEGWVLGWLGGETVRILAPERECPGNQASRWDVRVDGTGARLACSDEPPVAQPPAPVAPSGPPPPAPSAPQPPVRETEPPLPVRTTSPAAPDPAPAAARAPARPATLSVAEARGHARAALAGRVGRRPVKVLSCRRVARTAVRCRAGGHEVLVRRTVDGVTTRVTRAARARS